jgi:hypothetical protein
LFCDCCQKIEAELHLLLWVAGDIDNHLVACPNTVFEKEEARHSCWLPVRGHNLEAGTACWEIIIIVSPRYVGRDRLFTGNLGFFFVEWDSCEKRRQGISSEKSVDATSDCVDTPSLWKPAVVAVPAKQGKSQRGENWSKHDSFWGVVL